MCAKINKKYDIYLIPPPDLATFNIRIYRINNFYYHIIFSMSERTSGSAFSLILRAHDVCLTKRLSSPALGSGLGRLAIISCVIINFELSKSSCRFKVWRDSVTALYIENPYNGKFAYYIGR